jgi:hypothetical protein
VSAVEMAHTEHEQEGEHGEHGGRTPLRDGERRQLHDTNCGVGFVTAVSRLCAGS